MASAVWPMRSISCCVKSRSGSEVFIRGSMRQCSILVAKAAYNQALSVFPGIFPVYGSIRFLDESSGQDRAPEAADPARYFPLLLPRRQDRGAGPERCRQVYLAAHHGG